MKIKDFQEATIFFINPKQTITILKDGVSFKPCKYKYYECFIPDPEILIRMCKYLIKQGVININDLTNIGE